MRRRLHGYPGLVIALGLFAAQPGCEAPTVRPPAGAPVAGGAVSTPYESRPIDPGRVGFTADGSEAVALDAIRRHASELIPCPLEQVVAQRLLTFGGQPALFLVDGCGERVAYAACGEGGTRGGIADCYTVTSMFSMKRGGAPGASSSTSR